MKHPNFICQSHLPISSEKVKTLAEKTSRQLLNAGIGHKTEFHIDSLFDGIDICFKFSNPIIGRDRKKNSIRCDGFHIFVYNRIGRDEKKDEHGRFIWNKESNSVELEGKSYRQYDAHFAFIGKCRRFRGRRENPIQPILSFDYDTEMKAFDFKENVRYLQNIF